VELARKAQERVEAKMRREARRSDAARCRSAAFASPSPLQRRGLAGPPGGGASRVALPAMILPRWESLERFSVDALDLSALELPRGDAGVDARASSKLLAVKCTVCGAAAGAGQAVVALLCSHAFCARCFEAHLRRTWVGLPDRAGRPADKEEHISCPACGTDLARSSVHTLNGDELLRLRKRWCAWRSSVAVDQPAPGKLHVARLEAAKAGGPWRSGSYASLSPRASPAAASPTFGGGVGSPRASAAPAPLAAAQWADRAQQRLDDLHAALAKAEVTVEPRLPEPGLGGRLAAAAAAQPAPAARLGLVDGPRPGAAAG